MAKVIIFGTGTLGKLMHFYLSADSPHEVAAFTLDSKYITESSYLGLPLVPFEEIETHYPPDQYKMLVAIGYKQLNSLRTRKFLEGRQKGYQFISYLSSRATHWNDTAIGENCILLENLVIQPFVTIGNNVVIWGGTHLGHDVVIKDNCWLSSQIVVSGGVEIGASSFIGVNATIRDHVKVGDECIIGAGAIILRDAKDKEVYIAKSTDLYRLNSTEFEQMMEISRR